MAPVFPGSSLGSSDCTGRLGPLCATSCAPSTPETGPY